MLPGETWRDMFERRGRVDALRQSIADGVVNSIESLVVENIDLRSLLVDTIRSMASPEDVLGAWEETSRVSVLDPTCGSGAFLFAALDILDDVYAAILETAEAHVRSRSPWAVEVLQTVTARRKAGKTWATSGSSTRH